MEKKSSPDGEAAPRKETVDAAAMMKEEEAKFQAKYGLTRTKGSEILHRRISRGGKGQYFDSGDYNASKSRTAMGPPLLRANMPRDRKVSAPSRLAPSSFERGDSSDDGGGARPNAAPQVSPPPEIAT